MPFAMTEDGYRRLKSFAAEAGLDEGEALSFLFENFQIGLAISCRYVPINVSDIITRLIFTYLRKLHTHTFKDGMIFSREYFIYHSGSFNLYTFYFFDDLRIMTAFFV